MDVVKTRGSCSLRRINIGDTYPINRRAPAILIGKRSFGKIDVRSVKSGGVINVRDTENVQIKVQIIGIRSSCGAPLPRLNDVIGSFGYNLEQKARILLMFIESIRAH